MFLSNTSTVIKLSLQIVKTIIYFANHSQCSMITICLNPTISLPICLRCMVVSRNVESIGLLLIFHIYSRLSWGNILVTQGNKSLEKISTNTLLKLVQILPIKYQQVRKHFQSFWVPKAALISNFVNCQRLASLTLSRE